MKKAIFPILFLLIILNLYSEKFQFKYNKGNKYRIEAEINGKLYNNNQLVSKYAHKYKTIRKIINEKNRISDIQDNTYFYNLSTLSTNQVYEIKDEAIVNYSKDSFGKMHSNTNDSLLTYRNVPVFPDEDIKPGQEWEINGNEVQDLFNDGTLSVFPIKVKYKFLGYEENNGRKLAKFIYSHNIDITNNNSLDIDNRITRVVGKSETIMYFDNEKGMRVREEYKRDYAFLIGNNVNSYIAEFIDNGVRNWDEIELMDKDKVVSDLERKLVEEDLEDTEVKKDDKGVKLSIENLHFYPNSTELLPEEKVRFDKIAKILKDYTDHGLMIIGHTALAGTEEGRKVLSIERAKAIVDLLATKNAINLSKSSYAGKGSTEPIADNNTEEGMKKNRRVEIYILEE